MPSRSSGASAAAFVSGGDMAPYNATKAAVVSVSETLMQELRALFGRHGSVESVNVITDRETGRPRGFGFVEMSSGDATKAMQALNGKDFEGRALKVNEAKPRENNRGGGGDIGDARIDGHQRRQQHQRDQSRGHHDRAARAGDQRRPSPVLASDRSCSRGFQ